MAQSNHGLPRSSLLQPRATYFPAPPRVYIQRGTPSKNRSFFSTGGSDNHTPRTPADVSWIREQAGTTPRALDRDFLAASPGTPAADVGGGAAKQASSTSTTKGKMFNRRTWTKEENDQLQEGMASLGGPEANLGKNVSGCYRCTYIYIYTQVLKRVDTRR